MARDFLPLDEAEFIPPRPADLQATLKQACLPRPRIGTVTAVTTQEALDLFRSTGALLEGHFVLRSGLHSRQFFQCALALQQMPIVERFGAALAEKLRPLGATTVIDCL